MRVAMSARQQGVWWQAPSFSAHIPLLPFRDACNCEERCRDACGCGASCGPESAYAYLHPHVAGVLHEPLRDKAAGIRQLLGQVLPKVLCTDTAAEHLKNTNAKEAGPSSDRPHALTQRKR